LNSHLIVSYTLRRRLDGIPVQCWVAMLLHSAERKYVGTKVLQLPNFVLVIIVIVIAILFNDKVSAYIHRCTLSLCLIVYLFYTSH